MNQELLDNLSEQVQKGKAEEVAILTQKALDNHIAPDKILDEALIKAMTIVGDKFKRNEAFVPEMLIAARAMNKALEILEPELVKTNVQNKGIIVIGTVKGDLHDIGKNLVGIMFKGVGYKVIDLGSNVTPDKFLEAVEAHQPNFVGLSALLTTTMVHMKEVIDLLKSKHPEVKIIVGGAPVSDEFAREINADGYADDAASAVAVAKSLLTS